VSWIIACWQLLVLSSVCTDVSRRSLSADPTQSLSRARLVRPPVQCFTPPEVDWHQVRVGEARSSSKPWDACRGTALRETGRVIIPPVSGTLLLLTIATQAPIMVASPPGSCCSSSSSRATRISCRPESRLRYPEGRVESGDVPRLLPQWFRSETVWAFN
jgi:hypothetical protein